MRRLRHLTSLHRTPATNRLLGFLLAFNAGAINAGGFLVVGMYTSHMSGFVSALADNLVLGHLGPVLAAVGAVLAFTAGAAVTAVLVNWARQHHLRSGYALPLLLEALLMLVFGLIGATLNLKGTPFAVPLTVLLLAFIMGLQNALVTKISSATIRTTHMTGVVTDLGIELGKLLYWNGKSLPEQRVHASQSRLRLFATLLGLFTLGGVVGAAGFSHVGFVWVLPLALVLLSLSLPPLFSDLKRFVQTRLRLAAPH
jgi:uncharacterized membrane protein YoaK (UPF0700 family)